MGGIAIIEDNSEIIIRGIEDRINDTTPLLNRIGMYLVSKTHKRINDGIEPENAPVTQAYKGNSKPLRDTGAYMASFDYEIVDGSSVKVGTPMKQGKVLQEGAVIKPKKAKFLYIPAGSQTRKFERQYPPVNGSSVRGVMEGLENAGWNVFHSGGAVMAQKTNRSKPIVLYFKKKQIEIPARKHLYADDEDRRYIIKLTVEYIADGTI
jgi:hypothetical protein